MSILLFFCVLFAVYIIFLIIYFFTRINKISAKAKSKKKIVSQNGSPILRDKKTWFDVFPVECMGMGVLKAFLQFRQKRAAAGKPAPDHTYIFYAVVREPKMKCTFDI